MRWSITALKEMNHHKPWTLVDDEEVAAIQRSMSLEGCTAALSSGSGVLYSVCSSDDTEGGKKHVHI